MGRTLKKQYNMLKAMIGILGLGTWVYLFVYDWKLGLAIYTVMMVNNIQINK